jgi:hypothetical protein
VKSGLPKTIFPHPRYRKAHIKGGPQSLFYDISKRSNVRKLAQMLHSKLKLNSEPDSSILHDSQVFFIMATKPVILSITEQDLASKEEALIDRDSDVFDTEITVSPISVSKSNLLDNVGKQIPFLEAAQASITPYVVEVIFPFPEFVNWCAEQYSREEKVILNKLGSEVLCEIDSPSIRHTLSIPESSPSVSEPFEEEKMITVYRECPSEVKTLFLQTIVKPEHHSESLSLPINVSVMVIEVQWACSILSQILGLDNDKFVVEVMLGFLLTFFLSESSQSVCISFEKFIADNMHQQLVNFNSLRHFRYYTHLLRMFLESNKTEFPEATFISTECKRITMLIFINKIMSRVYSLIFGTDLPRVLEEMKISLQPNPENRVGDWMLFTHSTVIWVYGYQEGPYLFPVFLTPRVFSIEFIRQRIISETEHFLKTHKASNLKFPFIIGPFVVKTRSCLPQIQAKLSGFGFTQLQGRKYDPHQIISKRRLMSRQGPYEHEHVEGFDELANRETCADMEVTLQPDQTQQIESSPQQIQTQKTSPKLIIKAPKMSVYNKRSSSEALGASSQQNILKKMKITPSSQIVDLEEEEPKEKMSMEMVESVTKNEEAGTGSMPQSESSSRVFSSKKHVFGKTPGAVYQSKEDLMNQYVVKGSMANSEIRDLFPEVEKISQHKASLFSVRDVERKTFNIAIADDDKVSEIKMHYENIGAPDKVKFHRNASDMLYSDYLSLSLRVSRLTTHALKLDGQLKQEKASSKAWQTQVKRLESEGPQGVKASLDEKEKMIQSLKKKLKMSATEHPQTTELASLEKEKETFRQEALNYKAKVLQLEKEKENWSQGQVATSDMVVIVPSNTESWIKH